MEEDASRIKGDDNLEMKIITLTEEAETVKSPLSLKSLE